MLKNVMPQSVEIKPNNIVKHLLKPPPANVILIAPSANWALGVLFSHRYVKKEAQYCNFFDFMLMLVFKQMLRLAKLLRRLASFWG